MGQIAPFTHKTIHNITIKNLKGDRVATLKLSGLFTNMESYGHLKDMKGPQKSGPESRRVISTLTELTVTQGNFNESATAEDKKNIETIAKNLMENKGLKPNAKEILSADKPEFPAAFTSYIKSEYNLVADFSS